CKKNNYSTFSIEIGMEFLQKNRNISFNKKLKYHEVFWIRTIKVLEEIVNYGYFLKCHRNSAKKVVKIYEDLLLEYLIYCKSRKLSERTIIGKKIVITRFLNSIYQQNIFKISDLTTEKIYHYLFDLSDYSDSSKANILFILRDFLRFIHETERTKKAFNELFPIIKSNKRENNISYYEINEIKKIIKIIDTKTKIGKRDYLIILLATHLGMRAGDIRLLKIENIFWDKKTIEYVQQKTKIPIQLPLLENIKFALLDYLKNSRSKNDSTFIFIRYRAPYIPYTALNTFNYIINKYMKLADIDTTNRKHGLHSMRFSLASNLLKNNVKLPVITGVLGHKNSNTTKKYLSIDIDQLRSLGLEVPYEK
ncbi:MAG: tyrosine-type recombinase/integrase, partial [Bacillota bacterium]|nr:tyrosine-type recombinase/integrase [Bacillota bacterium]